jgi:LuxR family maltose regulon positive regulatory protein
MVRSSILERLSGPLCDAVLETEGSAELLAELEQANLFLIALDDHRHWYRYHHLFAQLLRVELAGLEPGPVAGLHRRPPPSTSRPATSRRPCTTPAPAATSIWPAP